MFNFFKKKKSNNQLSKEDFEKELENILIDSTLKLEEEPNKMLGIDPEKTAKNHIDNIVLKISEISDLKHLKGGFRRIYDTPNFINKIYDGVSLNGFNERDLSNALSRNGFLYVFYVAVPVDENDDLLENEALSDWDFEDRILKQIVPSQTICTGAFYEDSVKFRTIKFIHFFSI